MAIKSIPIRQTFFTSPRTRIMDLLSRLIELQDTSKFSMRQDKLGRRSCHLASMTYVFPSCIKIGVLTCQSINTTETNGQGLSGDNVLPGPEDRNPIGEVSQSRCRSQGLRFDLIASLDQHPATPIREPDELYHDASCSTWKLLQTQRERDRYR